MGGHRGLEFRGRIRDLGAILLRRSFRALGKPHDLIKTQCPPPVRSAVDQLTTSSPRSLPAVILYDLQYSFCPWK